jgi:hypothetical protein
VTGFPVLLQPWMTGTLAYADPFWRNDCVGRRNPDHPGPVATSVAASERA